jgi:hypothetical protein
VNISRWRRLHRDRARHSKEAMSMTAPTRRWMLALGLVPVAICLALPKSASAGDLMAGSGDIEAPVGFSVPVQPIGSCGPDSWSITQGVSEAAVVRDLSGSNYVGGLSIGASGASTPSVCTNAGLEVGAINSISANGSSSLTNSSMSCSAGLNSGNYFRVGPAVLVIASANCTVSGLSSVVTFLALGDLTPTQSNPLGNNNGITGTVTAAEFVGDFEIVS